MRRIFVFDLDGTLVDTNAVDARCFVESAWAAHRIALDDDWSRFSQPVDSVIAREAFAERHGRPPAASEVAQWQGALVRCLAVELERHPAAFAPIAGAERLVERLRAAGHAVVVATGSWRRSAALKLSPHRFGFAADELFTAEDGDSKRAILAAAVDRAGEWVGRTAPVVSFGDSSTDCRAARALGYRAIGIADGPSADSLRAAGATLTLPHYADETRLAEALT